MREIKFRAWEKQHKKMIPYEVVQEHFDFIAKNADTYDLMQYTGLKDKNGKEIYEGDIIVCHSFNWDYLGIVAYDETYDTGSFYLKNTIKCTNEIVDLSMSRFAGDSKEILGNIYENPESLEGVQK